MIEDLLKNETFLKYFPILAGVVFAVLFVFLGMWQLERAAEKNEMRALFGEEAPYAQPVNFESLQEFDRIQLFGQYIPDRQILIDNIPREGRLGYYVISAFRPSAEDALLLVNRGWVQKAGPGGEQPEIGLDDDFKTIHGLAGHLPRVAIRPGEAFEGSQGWPRIGVYPTLDEVALELGEPVLPVVLLLSASDPDGFVRRWEPDISGPMTHYSYAFQWFAMAAAVIGIAGWHTRKRFRKS